MLVAEVLVVVVPNVAVGPVVVSESPAVAVEERREEEFLVRVGYGDCLVDEPPIRGNDDVSTMRLVGNVSEVGRVVVIWAVFVAGNVMGPPFGGMTNVAVITVCVGVSASGCPLHIRYAL